MELVTGHAGTLHITAKQVSRLLRGVTATDESTVQRLNVGNNAAITYSGITMSIASGELLLDGYHVTLVDDTGGASGETLIFDATLESTNSRIDKVVLEIIQDNTTSYQRAEIVIVQGEESESPVAPATPTEPESSTEEFLAVGVIAQVTITGDDISSLNDLTNLYGGSYLDLETFNEYVSEISTVNVKNLLPYPYTDTTKTVNGITFTDNGDGTITANGTATDTATFTLGTTSEYLDYDKSYILNGCPVNGSEGTYYIQTDVSNWIDTGSGVEFMRDLSMAGASIVIAEGTTVSNLTFSPMIRLAVIEDDTYEPYAMTNQELTKNVQDIENDIPETQDIISDAWSSSKTYAADEYCISGNKLYKCLVANTGTQPPNTTYWEETTCAEELGELNSNLTETVLWTNSDSSIGMSNTTVTLSDSIQNYKRIGVYYKVELNDSYFGYAETDVQNNGYIRPIVFYGFTNIVLRRAMGISTGTSLSFEIAAYLGGLAGSNTWTSYSGACIPVKVVGYKL